MKLTTYSLIFLSVASYAIAEGNAAAITLYEKYHKHGGEHGSDGNEYLSGKIITINVNKAVPWTNLPKTAAPAGYILEKEADPQYIVTFAPVTVKELKKGYILNQETGAKVVKTYEDAGWDLFSDGAKSYRTVNLKPVEGHWPTVRGNEQPPATPAQELFLLDMPVEIQLLIAECCHRTKREEARDLRLPGENKQKAIGGGLDRLSRVNKTLRRRVMPLMFAHLRISCDEALLHTELAELLASDNGILEAARTRCIYTLGPHVTFGHRHNRIRQPWGKCDASAPELLGHVLKAVSGLHEVALQLKYGSHTIMPAFRKHARESGLILPNIKGLQFGTDVDHQFNHSFMAEVCPNLERARFHVRNSPAQTLGLSVFGRVESLREVQLHMSSTDTRSRGWNADTVQQIVTMFPNVRRIFMTGLLDYAVPRPLANLAPVLSQFTNLEVLVVPRGPQDPDDEPYAEDPNEVSRVFFKLCPRLEEFYIEHRLFGNEVLGVPQGFRVVDGAGSFETFEIPDDPQGAFEPNPRYNSLRFPRFMQVSARPGDKHTDPEPAKKPVDSDTEMSD
ncbi:Uu.00g116380.m01.CDS01 [Anthostomella pinea]|uniref:Uu.00g116380.m01.CDS01 n=1 Tax=Anthostomella pinea TaxID=933095 RepID=A0AAI8YGU0_9PEZI|nr:Uu.00g116380.m01.CDS01 [Anthostomella pinea]